MSSDRVTPNFVPLKLFEIPPLRPYMHPECVGCGVNVSEIREIYMVHDDAWPIGTRDGQLCIRCLEQRLGRRLRREDFTDVPLNEGPRSRRLRSRLEGQA